MGRMYFRYGAMGASKTAQALITQYNYQERGLNVLLIKPAMDTRDGVTTLRSRIGLASEAIVVAPEDDVSCTSPLISFLYSALTGTTYLPFLWVIMFS